MSYLAKEVIGTNHANLINRCQTAKQKNINSVVSIAIQQMLRLEKTLPNYASIKQYIYDLHREIQGNLVQSP